MSAWSQLQDGDIIEILKDQLGNPVYEADPDVDLISGWATDRLKKFRVIKRGSEILLESIPVGHFENLP